MQRRSPIGAGSLSAWVAGTRYDCLLAAAGGGGWDAVAKRAEALLLHPASRECWKAAPAAFVAATLDHARATL